MKYILTLISISSLITLILLPFPTAFAATKSPSFIQVKYKQSSSSQDKEIIRSLKKDTVSETVAEVLNDILKMPKPLSLVFGGKDGPLYDNELHSILIPYDFIYEVQQRFKKAKYAESGLSLNDAVMDVVMHTILHEVAHALINTYDLPIVTKEEDAADSLATLLLIEYFEDGEEIVLTAADLFDLESDDIEEFQEEDFWDEHSLDAQRYYSTICHIYGSNPKRYAHLKKENRFSKERAELCIDEYEQLVYSWSTLLKPVFNKGKHLQ